MSFFCCTFALAKVAHTQSRRKNIARMKRIFYWIAAMTVSLGMTAGEHDLLWDYTDGVPTANPDRGLAYASTVNDADGVKNGLKGIKLNSSGWCSFTKASVSGVLRLTFGPRSGMNAASLQICCVSGDTTKSVTQVATTGEVRRLRTQAVYLTAEQNTVYITRLLETETVLQRIEFVEAPQSPIGGEMAPQSPEGEGEDEIELNEIEANEKGKYLIHALEEANKTGNKTIYLTNGVYDLGSRVLTAIEANHIAIIGESMEGVVIRNQPDYRIESIDRSATLRIASGVEGTYLQNLTIENALDYYKDDNGRAVALWDQGTKTICKHVRLKSHQDTYYSDHQGGLKYFEDSEIYGTVDFICGNGNVYFLRTLLYCKPRSKDGSGTDALTASNAYAGDKGYVFESCRVQSECPVVSLGRSWKNQPRCVFLRTVLDDSAGPFGLENKDIRRWTMAGMSVLPEKFGEYDTRDKAGRVVSPETNEVTFHYKGETKTMNTILTADEAARYTMEYVLGEWGKTIENTIYSFNQNYQQ